ncbi:putative snf2 family protein [Botrytis fragariae]|uniref:Putative snf2 family protein n=1 Tax=Botrytis fragariae TaxID=1964551 RepID=A0A8H6B054_9HELO|nr:putative snf2 family protein [Botrytis fragariae]KAF5876909.1 putative snf2 family protein [Botrytis fragariae]
MPPQLTRVNVSSLPADQRICAICQDNFGGGDNGEPVKTACNHVFDRECVQRWLDADHTTCPICREEIRNISGGVREAARDRIRQMNNAARRVRDRAAEEREQMMQAQADYGGGNEIDHLEGIVGEELEPMPLDVPGNFSTPAPPRHRSPVGRPASRRQSSPPRRFPSPPPHRYHSPPIDHLRSTPPRISSSSSSTSAAMQHAEATYTNALSALRSLDTRIINQARLSYEANVVKHDAERNVQLAFQELQHAVRSDNQESIDLALAMQESVTMQLDDAHNAMAQYSTPLREWMEERPRASERLDRARLEFAREREGFMSGVGGARREIEERGHQQDFEDEDEEAWEPYDPRNFE